MKKAILLALTVLSILITTAQGYYMEYKLTSGAAEANTNGTLKTYAQDGNTRMEMNMNVEGFGKMNVVNLVLKSSPNTVYLLDETAKTYTQLSGADDEDWADYPQSEYEVTVVGKEKVNGYNATHVRVKRVGSKTGALEMWNTTEIAGYAEYAGIKSKYTGKDNMLKAMQAKGAAGFPVRVKAAEKNYTMQMDLVKAEKRSNPSSLFSLSGYTKSREVNYAPGTGDMQEMIKKIQNMTPEEQEQWIKQMQQQYAPK